jgi:hypothetical protein
MPISATPEEVIPYLYHRLSVAVPVSVGAVICRPA